MAIFLINSVIANQMSNMAQGPFVLFCYHDGTTHSFSISLSFAARQIIQIKHCRVKESKEQHLKLVTDIGS